MANPAAPRASNDATGVPLLYGIHDIASADEPALYRIVTASVIADETTKSGAIAVAALTLHDAADPASSGPIKIGGYAKATPPTAVSADADRVNAWFALDGSLAVVSQLSTSSLRNGGTSLTPKFATIAASSSGDNTVVSGVSTKKLRVLSYAVTASGAVNAKFQSSTAGDITGLLYLAANGGVVAGFNPLGHFETVAGEDLQLNLSGAVAVGGHIAYVEV